MKTEELILTPEQQVLLPTEEDICFYEEHGWYISQPVIPETIIDLAIAGSQAFYRGERDATLKVDTGYSNWKPEDGEIVRNNEFVSLQKKELRQLALQPIIGAIAAKLARTNEIRLLDDQLVYKPAFQPHNQINTAVGQHSDRAYWGTCSKEIHIFDEQLCRRLPNGYPDFSDPDVFPVIWSKLAADS
jgi:hypothetical protein